MAVTDEISPLDRKIIRQVEHYFGDFNLTKDRFLQETVKENEGWVSMETMLKFKRLAALTTDAKQILASLKKSSSGLMEVSEEGEGKIRRSPEQPLPENNEENKKKQEARTAYAKGYDKEKTTMDELLEYYTEHEPSIVHVQMRNYMDNKTKTKNFKGSVFLTFRTEEDCKAFVEKEGGHEYKDNKLESIMYQKDYFAMKSKEYEEKKNKKNKKNADKKEADQEAGDNKEKEKEEEISLPKGAVLKFTGLGGDMTREDLKEKLHKDFGVNISKEKDGEVAFVTYEKGEPEAKMRFKAENFGKDLMEKISKVDKFIIKDTEVTVSLLEGEEEANFLAETLKELKNLKAKQKNHKRKNHGKGGGYNKKMRRE
eukprot:TRINITY_DN7457_c0_g1_i2.p1 TRINITY_DN7457_c0_g1~~TRINITY_DN7457_c0_g1_i2.p1  ORF type:complete len:370 (-),score=172.40 TRINITY_DN7457_c0_g1_i2:387-1496(-)